MKVNRPDGTREHVLYRGVCFYFYFFFYIYIVLEV